MPGEGLEPSWAQGPADFESAASTNSATPALGPQHAPTGVRVKQGLPQALRRAIIASMPSAFRRTQPWDALLTEMDRALFFVFCKQPSSRPYPAEGVQDARPLTQAERRLSAALMRVNHAGEVCAQALYEGQSITARDPAIAARLRKAAEEEADHLNWCRRRVEELGGRTSLLDPFWYFGSLAIGMTAGLFGDRWNLGFLEETERQVEAHLDGHLRRLPEADRRSRAIVEQMKIDERGHAELARSLGAAELPDPVKTLMRLAAKVMTTIAERI